MIRINILTPKSKYPISLDPGIWYPVLSTQSLFKKNGISFSFFHDETEKLFACDIIILSSRYFGASASWDWNKVRRFLENIKSKNIKIIWFDMRDSAGTTQFEVLPYVDEYWKKQLYKDITKYKTLFYGNREFTDFIHQKFSVIDDYTEEQVLLNDEFTHKIKCAWNIGLEQTELNLLDKKSRIKRSLSFALRNKIKPVPRKIRWGNPSMEKKHSLCALFNTKYERQTISWQRQTALEILRNENNPNNLFGIRLPRPEYIEALYNSQFVLSLFGWGEICYREWEAVIAGSAVIMPDISSLQTWPDIYQKNKTYIPLDWDLSNLPTVLQEISQHPELGIEIAKNAQNRLKLFYGEEGNFQFHRYLSELINP